MDSDERSKLLHAQALIWNQAMNYMNAASLKCAVELGIPDVIHNHGRPMILDELVAALPVNPTKAQCLRRLMRLLIHSGFFIQEKINETEQEEGYCLTPAAHLLLKDDPFNAKAILLFALDPSSIKPWNFLSDWLKNDDPTAFHTAHGITVWEYQAQEPRIGNVFQEIMDGDSRFITSMLMKDQCRGVFDDLTSLVDIGGGKGTTARAIAEEFPNLKCTVLDLPSVVADLQGSENLEFVGGDMFEAIPPANAILLKWILHNWGDEECVRILKNCKKAIPSKEKGGKLIIIDIIMDGQNEDAEFLKAQLLFDMQMLTFFAGKERNEKEWEKLFLAAGFSQYKIISMIGFRSLIEVYP